MRIFVKPDEPILGSLEYGEQERGSKFVYRDLFFYVIFSGEGDEKFTLERVKVAIREGASTVLQLTLLGSRLLEVARKYARLVGWDFRGLEITKGSKVIIGVNVLFEDLNVDNIEVTAEALNESGETMSSEVRTRLITYEPKTELILPFRGAWYAIHAYDMLSSHRFSLSQRFAVDFLKVDVHGRTFRGDGLRHEDYYAFGQPILAPGDGVVIDMANDVDENVPKKPPSEEDFRDNPYRALGNFVLIDHENSEYSLLAHLRKGSVRVRRGERVKRGQLIAECGYSGNATEPGLHYHLMAGPDPFTSPGLPCIFTRFESRVLNTKVLKGPIIPRDIVSPL